MRKNCSFRTTLETIRCIPNDAPIGFIPGRIPKITK
jgi:hypothetical protein